MKKAILILIMATTGIFSCREGSNSAPDNTLNSTKKVEGQKTLTNDNENYITLNMNITSLTAHA